MAVDSILQSLFRSGCRRCLSFDDSPSTNELPTPDPDKAYLLYLHVPFCVVLCPFCSFHRVEFNHDRTGRYFDALRKEIRLATRVGFRFQELYVGGGTPTVMPDELTETIRLVRELHPIEEVSVETNPDDLDDGRLPDLIDVGVNRLSVGVQSFDDALLKEMQRYEKYGSSARIRERLKRVQGSFGTLNVDMIFNFPHQSPESLQNDLVILTDELLVDQVSFYPLMTAGTTRRSMQRELGEVDYRRERSLYRMIARHMLDAGYTRASAWCFSRVAGMFDEYITEHNEYLGLGSGSFSFMNGSMYASTFSINHYLQLTEAGQTGIFRQRRMSSRDQMLYYLLMRLFSGSLDKSAAEARFDGQFSRSLIAELTGLRLVGAVRDTGRELRLTESGYYLWVTLMREFFTAVNNIRDEMRHNIPRETAILQAS